MDIYTLAVIVAESPWDISLIRSIRYGGPIALLVLLAVCIFISAFAYRAFMTRQREGFWQPCFRDVLNMFGSVSLLVFLSILYIADSIAGTQAKGIDADFAVLFPARDACAWAVIGILVIFAYASITMIAGRGKRKQV